MAFYVYILASRRNGTLYIGMIDNLIRRVWEHRIGAAPGSRASMVSKGLSGSSSMNQENLPFSASVR
jgi:predicted GIY-YIG superfamily endonuclease